MRRELSAGRRNSAAESTLTIAVFNGSMLRTWYARARAPRVARRRSRVRAAPADRDAGRQHAVDERERVGMHQGRTTRPARPVCRAAVQELRAAALARARTRRESTREAMACRTSARPPSPRPTAINRKRTSGAKQRCSIAAVEPGSPPSRDARQAQRQRDAAEHSAEHTVAPNSEATLTKARKLRLA